MLIIKRRYITSKTGTILFQSIYRGHATRRVLASIKIQTQVRRRKHHVAYRKLKSATISLQCRQRRGIAMQVLAGLKHEQKDIGKLKQNNEKLKTEMASLKAMLAAQAKGDANKMESDKELKEKEEEIKRLEKRISQLEAEIEKEKEKVKQLETSLENEHMQISKHKEQISVLTQQNQNLSMHPPSPPRKSLSSSLRMPSSPRLMPSSPVPIVTQAQAPPSPGLTSQGDFTDFTIDTKALAEQRALVVRLEQELEKERSARRETDGEVIKLRAQMGGVNLNEDEIKALLPTDEDIKSSIILPSLDPIDMQIEASNTSHTEDTDDR
jgi:uncharacterized coiled-coil protein SlyX